MTKVKYTGEDIGSEVLYSLSKGLYSDPYHVIREYLQNAVDAFPENINMTVQGNNIYIYDDGEGMDENDIDTCRKVGVCYKDPTSQVGFRGIGIWAGLIYVKKLIITSSKEGSNKKYILTIDFENIVKDITKGRKAKGTLERTKILTNVLSEHVYRDEKPEEQGEHYTKVELRDITDNGKKLVSDNDGLIEYIGRTLPVDFADKFPHKKEVNHLLSLYVPNYKIVKVKFNDMPIYKPYPQDVDLFPPDGYMLLDGGKQIGYMWECLHSKHKKIKSKYAGLVYKIKGFTIGNADTPRVLWGNIDDHFHLWYFGEIHITDTEITPNTAREDLEQSNAKRNFFVSIKKEIKKLRQKARMVSGKKRAIKKVEEAQETLEKITLERSTLKKSSLPKLIKLKTETDNNIKDLERLQKEIKKVTNYEKEKISKRLANTLKKLRDDQEKINKEINSRDKKQEIPTKKIQPKEPTEKPTDYRETIDKMITSNQCKKVLYLVIDILTEITSKKTVNKFIKILSDRIKELSLNE